MHVLKMYPFIFILLLAGNLVNAIIPGETPVPGTGPDTPREQYVLFSGMTTNYAIVLSTEASESEVWAANELQHWLTEISGAYFPIAQYSGNDLPAKPQQKIYVGFSDALKNKTGNPAPSTGDESFRYFNRGPEIYIYGGKQRGTMYGVMAFLENEFGCRWYTPVVKKIPPRESYIFTSLNHREAPGVRVRNNFFYTAFDPVWAARNKMNGRMSSDPVNQPGGVESYWGVHTFFTLVPPEEFFEDHPEYYSLVDGERRCEHTRGQLCLSNPDVLKIATRRIKEVMREHPEHLIYSVSQGDTYPGSSYSCECRKCRAIKNKYGGQESGILIWFVNQVAKAVEKEFPEKFIGTLAYRYTRSAPEGIKPRDNVVIRLCPIEACAAHPLESCPENQAFLEDMKDWSSLAKHLYIWDYAVNFLHYIMPHPNYEVLQPNIQTFIANNAIGIMEQGSYQARGGEFQALKSWLIAKLLWNPDIDADKAIDDFMFGYYGRSGQYVREYFDGMQNLVKPRTHINCYTKVDDPVFTGEFIRESLDILRKARKIADNEAIARRVDMATLPVLYLKCKRSPVDAKNDGTFDQFLRICEREGITRLSEGGENIDSFKKSVLEAKPEM